MLEIGIFPCYNIFIINITFDCFPLALKKTLMPSKKNQSFHSFSPTLTQTLIPS